MLVVLLAGVLGCAPKVGPHVKVDQEALQHISALTAENKTLKSDLQQCQVDAQPRFGEASRESLEATNAELRAQIEELKRYDARLVCGHSCTHRGLPVKKRSRATKEAK